MAKYILINKGKGTYGLGEESISPANLESLGSDTIGIPTLDQILEVNNTTIYPIQAKPAETDEELATLGQVKSLINNYVFNQRDGLVSGGIIQWSGAGFVYNVSTTVISLNGQLIEIPQGTVTLAPSDPDEDRIDVIYVTPTGYGVVEGTPAADPVEPILSDPTNEFSLGLVIVRAGSTTPENVNINLVYDENVEWAVTSGPVGKGVINSADTSNPFTGSLDINVTSLARPSFWIQFRRSSPIANIADYQSISFRLRLKLAFSITENIRMEFLNSADEAVSNRPIIQIQKDLINEYQQVFVSMGVFQFTNLTDIQALRIYWYDGKETPTHIGFYIDLVQLYGDPDVDPEEPLDPSIASPWTDSFEYIDGNPVSFSLTKLAMGTPTVYVNGQYQDPMYYTFMSNIVTFNVGLLLETGDLISITYLTGGVSSSSGDYVTVSDFNSAIGSLNTQIDVIEADITGLDSDVTALQLDINTIESDITTIENNIITVENDIVLIEADIVTIENDITTVENDIITIENNIITIEDDVTTLQTDLSALDTRVDETEVDIAAAEATLLLLDDVAFSGDYDDLINTPEFYFNSEDFSFNIGTSTLSKKGGPVLTTVTTNVNLLFDKDRVYGTIDSPTGADITESFANAVELTKAIVVYSNVDLVLSSIYKLETGSPTFDPAEINVITFEYYSDTFIGYSIKKFSFEPENLLDNSNTFSDYFSWQEVDAITRTQELDDSWTLVFGADYELFYAEAIPDAEQDYTVSFELKVVPADFDLTIYANPGFTPILLDSPLFPDTDGLTFVRVSRTFTIPAGKTEIFFVWGTLTGGNVEIQHAQLNTGLVVKPYIET